MKFISTRNPSIKKTLSEAIQSGLADDGGLFVPEKIPFFERAQLQSRESGSYAAFAENVLKPWFQDDELYSQLGSMCKSAFNFPIPLNKINDNTFILELFHGPTLSFKDIGARFLAECIARLSSDRKTTIMVATSGDTGSAVASALSEKSNIDVIILYPKGQISKRQEHQITCWSNNIYSFAVKGTFDDCQRLVKSAFTNPFWQQRFSLGSANSINIGRLLPQITYYAYTSMQFYEKYQSEAGFIIPTGNLGNATAGYLAKLMGYPIREIVLSTNANQTISDYLQTGNFQPRSSSSTLANAMDVGNPSNFERLQYLFPDFASMKKNVKAISVSDDEIKKTIVDLHENDNKIICPHTATAFHARKKLSAEAWIVVATADPCKFDTVIEPLIHQKIPVSPSLQALLDKPVHVTENGNSLEEIEKIIL